MNLKYILSILILVIMSSKELVFAQSISEIYLKKIQDAKEKEIVKSNPIEAIAPVVKKIEVKEISPSLINKLKLQSTVTNESFTLKTIDKNTLASSTLVSKYSNEFRIDLGFVSESIGYGIFYKYHPFEILQNNQASTWFINNRKNTARSMGANLDFELNEKNKFNINIGVDDSFCVRTLNSTNLTIDMFYSEFLGLSYSHLFNLTPNLKLIPEFKIINHFATTKDTYSIKNGESATISLGIENHYNAMDWQLKSYYGERMQESIYSKDRIRTLGIGLGLKINF